MITNIFSIFDPSSSLIKLNNISFIVITLLLTNQINKRNTSINQIINKVKRRFKKERNALINEKKGNNKIIQTTMSILLLLNLIALLPQTIASTSQGTLTLGIAITIWLLSILFSITKKPKRLIIHLTPQGTPPQLINFIVIVEIIRTIIRPITLCVRLTANITAGHLLISLLRNFFLSLSETSKIIIAIIPIILTVLERRVAIIQAYVFTTLISLYASENQYDKKIPSIPHSRKKTMTFNSISKSIFNHKLNNYLNIYKNQHYITISYISYSNNSNYVVNRYLKRNHQTGQSY